MKLLAALVALGTMILADISSADACSISTAPSANVFGRPDTTTRGHRPWIRLWMVKPTEGVQVSLVNAACAPDKVCAKGKPVPFERSGQFLRPKQVLASGARVQVVHGGTLIGDFTVVATDATKDLPAWDGFTPPRAEKLPEAMCAPAGAAITLGVKPTKADLADTVLLVYLAKPDPKRPVANLASIYSLSTLSAPREITLRSGHGDAWLTAKPARVWLALSDGDGHIGPVTEYAL